jgi:hypothetical protein
MNLPRVFGIAAAWLVLGCPDASADANVAVVARARPDYVARRAGPGGEPVPHSYVFMQGNFVESSTINRSLERTSFRRIAEVLAPELAKQRFFPAPSAEGADLLIAVHWGATQPFVSFNDMTARTRLSSDEFSPDRSIMHVMADSADAANGPLVDLASQASSFERQEQVERVAEEARGGVTHASNAVLLGYTDELHKLSRGSFDSALEQMLRHDLRNERYFIILKAYDLKAPPYASKRPVWTMHINVGSPGSNFHTALGRMSSVAAEFAGQSLDSVKSVRTNRKVPAGSVRLGDLIILGQEKAK